jgi:MFS family permease
MKGRAATQNLRLGLGANWEQFTLLVVVNGFVGAMVGLERSVLPVLAREDFGLASQTAILSFLITFGIFKPAANYFAGRFSDRFGRKPVLLTGWLAALPVPVMIILAPSWGWIVAANVLLGINQGLAWSTAIIMKIDLVGPRRRGLAMGLNETAGYAGVALASLATGYLAAAYGPRPAPFLLGIGFAVTGLLLTLFFVRDTSKYAELEAAQNTDSAEDEESKPNAREIFVRTSFTEHNLSSASQAGFANNLNDGMAWGLFPLFFAASGLSIGQIGVLAAVYPAVWSLGQIPTGWASDRLGRKWMIASGMWLQAGGILLTAATQSFGSWLAGAILMGLGTALVYPTLLAVIGDVAHPSWRASAVGVYRIWRDSSYAVVAVLAGVIADFFGYASAIVVVGIFTALSGFVVAVRMRETLSRN